MSEEDVQHLWNEGGTSIQERDASAGASQGTGQSDCCMQAVYGHVHRSDSQVGGCTHTAMPLLARCELLGVWVLGGNVTVRLIVSGWVNEIIRRELSW